jgi:hypothetical protein
MAITTFDGPIRSLGGIYQQGPSTIVEITASTTLNPVSHGGRIISVGGTLAANITLTLPTINVSTNATSSGPGNDPNTLNNEGVVYTIWVPRLVQTVQIALSAMFCRLIATRRMQPVVLVLALTTTLLTLTVAPLAALLVHGCRSLLLLR